MPNYYLSLDIETGGANKPIFALGAVVLVINDDKSLDLREEKFLSFKVPEEFDEAYYDAKTWAEFWGPAKRTWDPVELSENPNHTVLKAMNAKANCTDEEDLIKQFYTWWTEITKKYDNIRIVTDNPPFDVGYVDMKIRDYKPHGEKSLPLIHQWKIKDGVEYSSYMSTYDYNTFELLIEETFPSDNYPNPHVLAIIGSIDFEHDHNPLNDAKEQAIKFARVYLYMKQMLAKNM